jgi:cysteinyl-tRNA synthetase
MMAITIYNTLTNKKEEFIPVETGKVKFYLCGPTVYDYFHIGNARPFIVFDTYRRFLEYRGFDVTYVVNITDVDDKIIKRANEENRTPKEVAEKFTDAYLDDLKKLLVKSPDIRPKATEHISDMIQLIQKLLDAEVAYQIDGDVFYNVKRYKKYGQLSGKNIDDLQAGSRVDIDNRKKSPLDFALWKSAKPGEPYWETPWGKGRPGWHIECSVMSTKYLGETFDIHAGGEDLIFPHHENEIAQSCGIGNSSFAKYWMHNGFLNIRGEKMSKSLGNFLTTREILKKYPPEVLRLFFLQKHYRSPISYSEEILDETKSAWQRLQKLYDEIVNFGFQENSIDQDSLSPKAKEFYQFVDQNRNDFIAAMEDDFNSAKAIGKLFEIVKESNRFLNDGSIPSNEKSVLVSAKSVLDEFSGFLSLIAKKQNQSETEVEDLAKILDLVVNIRNELRKEKMWSLADKVRDGLNQVGYVIEDKPSGSVAKKK